MKLRYYPNFGNSNERVLIREGKSFDGISFNGTTASLKNFYSLKNKLQSSFSHTLTIDTELFDSLFFAIHYDSVAEAYKKFVDLENNIKHSINEASSSLDEFLFSRDKHSKSVTQSILNKLME